MKKECTYNGLFHKECIFKNLEEIEEFLFICDDCKRREIKVNDFNEK